MKNFNWQGFPGHNIVSFYCHFHLTTDVGGYRISTIGDCRKEEDDNPEDLGGGKYETVVFELSDNVCECGCGERGIKGWGGIKCKVYDNPIEAKKGHMVFCEMYTE